MLSEINNGFAIPFIVDGDASGNSCFLDGVAVKGCGIAQVLERGVKILILTTHRVLDDVAVELYAETRDAIDGGLSKSGTLVVHLVHRREGRYIDIVLPTTSCKYWQHKEQK